VALPGPAAAGRLPTVIATSAAAAAVAFGTFVSFVEAI
jgi:hypothetical protein